MTFLGIEIDATFIAFLAFTIFFIIAIYLKVPGMVMKSLDDRSAAIAKELHDTRRLREEAEKLLAEYKAKHAAAEAEAQTIVAHAKEQAAAMAADIRAQMKDAMARREQQATDRIRQAEERAVAEVRAASIDAAIANAESTLRTRMSDGEQAKLVQEGVVDLGRKFG